MKREDLEKLFGTKLGDESKTIIDEIMKINGEDVTLAKQKVPELEAQVQSLTAQYKSANEQIDALKSMKPDDLKKAVEDYKVKIAEMEKQGNEKVAAIKKDYEVDIALVKAGAKNTKAVKSLLDLEKVTFDKDGKVGGIEDQLKAIKTSDDYLFEPAQQKAPSRIGNDPSKHGDPSKGDLSLKDSIGDVYKDN